MNAISKSTKSGGCGCGGSSSGGCGCAGEGNAGLCACGDVGCTTCQNQGFVRPQFFAGQLLTEEDLQQLVDYVVAKNRLHNQHLWGDGVVCGLEVSCNPCGGGKVIVNPGYALDCCGNDLLLGCPQKLDINAMVRDLKRNLLGGIDCGDPCASKKETKDTESKPRSGGTFLPGTDIEVLRGEAEEATSVDTTRHYCLYIRYCENLTDPVSPYATDEGCTFQSCQPTRVSEGVRFELRCDEFCGCHQFDIRDRICACIGDLDGAIQISRYASSLHAANELNRPILNVNTTDPRVASQNFVNSVGLLKAQRIPTGTTAGISKDTGEEAAPQVAPSAAGAAQPPVEGQPLQQNISADEFEAWLENVRTADAHLAAYYLARAKAGQTKEGAQLDKVVSASAAELQQLATSVRTSINQVRAPERTRAYYDATLNRTIELSGAQRPTDEVRLLNISKGLTLAAADLQAANTTLASMREALLDLLDRSPRIGDCQLRWDIEKIRIPESNDSNDWVKVHRQLYEGWARYLKDCICSAFNPPCAPCDDPAVLLACLEVRDCEVIEICNLKRKFVISPMALRYWLPPLNLLGELIEKLCCPEAVCEDETASSITNQLRQKTSRFNYRKVRGLESSIFEAVCGTPDRRKQVVKAYGSEVGRSFDRSGLAAPIKQLWSQIVSDVRQAPVAASFLDQQRVPLRKTRTGEASVSDLITELAATLNTPEGQAALRAFAPDISDLANAKVAEAVKKLELGSAAKELKDVKRIRTENADLTKRLAELSNRVKKLEGGTSK